MTIVTPPRDAGALGGKMAWRVVLSDTKSFQNQYMVMQRLRPTSLLSKMKRSNKTYRILLLKTGAFQIDASSSANSLIGKKWIVAEGDDWKLMVMSWYKIEHYLIPMLQIPTRTYNISQVLDLLSSLEHKHIQVSSTNTNNGASSSSNTGNSKSLFEHVEESFESKASSSSSSTTTTTSIVDDKIYGLDDARDHMEQFQQLLGTVRSLVKNADNEKQKQRVMNQLSHPNGLSQLSELKLLSTKLDKYLKAAPKKDVVHQKLTAQYRELNALYEQDVVKNELVKRASSTSEGSKTRNVPTTTTRGERAFVSGSQVQVQQEQTQEPEVLLTTSQSSTIQVEKAIAKEKQKELKAIEHDLREVHEIFRDLNDLLIEQDANIDKIYHNVEKTTDDIAIGVDDLKKAKKLQNFRNIL